MLSITPVSFFAIHLHFGPYVTAIGSIGKGKGPNESPPSELTIPWAKLQDNPSPLALLNWQSQVSAFAGRGTELEELGRWVTNEPSVSVKFITGEGGVGKSRLAAQFGETLRKRK